MKYGESRRKVNIRYLSLMGVFIQTTTGDVNGGCYILFDFGVDDN